MSSFFQLPTKEEGKLPEITESEEELEPIEVTYWKCRRQIIAGLIMSIGVLSLGSVFGWATFSVTELQKEDKIPVYVGLMSSIFIIGALLSGPAVAYLMVKLGRRNAMITQVHTLMIGWIVISITQFVKEECTDCAAGLIYFGRFLTGFGGAGCFTIAPIYVGEISDNKIHSLMGSLVPLILELGNLLPIIMGTADYGWYGISVACSCVPPVLAILVFWMPHSPH